MQKSAVLMVLIVLVAAPGASAQSPPASEEVFVRMHDGVEMRGNLLSLGSGSLLLFVDGSRREIPVDAVDRIQRRGDRVTNGALIGAAIGASLWGITVAQHGGEMLPYAFGAAIGYGLVGAGVDAMISGRTTIYSRPTSAATRAGGKRGGIALRFGF